MRFRLSHLLVLTALVATFAAALAFPSRTWAAVIRVVVWIVFGQLIWIGASRSGRVRVSALVALAAGIGYIMFCNYWYQVANLAQAPGFIKDWYTLLHWGGSGSAIKYVAFVLIAEYGLSLLLALVGGLVVLLVKGNGMSRKLSISLAVVFALGFAGWLFAQQPMVPKAIART